jgi:hypothetical protein
MRYTLLRAMVPSLVALVGACSSDENATTVATNATYVAPVADFGITAETALWYDGVYDPLAGIVIAQVTPTTGDAGIVVDGGALDAGALDRAAIAKLFPRPISGLLAVWRAVVRADCVPMVPSVDNDQDGVPASYNATFNCSALTVGNRTSSVTGTVAITDTDDSAKLSGFSVTFTNFTVATTVAGRSRTRTLNGTATLAPATPSTFQSTTDLSVAFDFADPGAAHTLGTCSTKGQGTYMADPTVGTDVFAGGTVTFSGASTLSRTIAGASQSRPVARQTNSPLHWNRGCFAQNADSLGYDSGTLVYQDDRGSRVEVRFNGCGSPTIITSG